MGIGHVIMLGFLLAAALMDIKSGRINNELILIMIAVGWACRLLSGPSDYGTLVVGGLINMVIPAALLFGVFLIKGIGAGDVKLFVAAACFMTWDQLLICMLFSFVTAGVMSIVKLITNRRLIYGFKTIYHFACDLFIYGELKEYPNRKDDRHTIHFAVAILIGCGAGLVYGGVVKH